jgi:hypothetical protein
MALEIIVPKIICQFIGYLQGKLPLKLAVDYNDSKVLFWAVIKDGEEVMEDILIHCEAKVNA